MDRLHRILCLRFRGFALSGHLAAPARLLLGCGRLRGHTNRDDVHGGTRPRESRRRLCGRPIFKANQPGHVYRSRAGDHDFWPFEQRIFLRFSLHAASGTGTIKLVTVDRFVLQLVMADVFYGRLATVAGQSAYP